MFELRRHCLSESGIRLGIRNRRFAVNCPSPSQFTDTKPNFSDLPMPPEILRSWLSRCTEAEQIGILRLRAKLLASSDRFTTAGRIREAVDGNWIRYGSGKTKRVC